MPKINSKTIHTLEKKIAAARRRLQELYYARGYTDSVVLSASIKLDKLINQYEKLSDNTVTGLKNSFEFLRDFPGLDESSFKPNKKPRLNRV